MSGVRVSAVIVTWNSRKWLPRCFGSLEAQTLHDLELVVVDNGSKDGSVEWVCQHYPRAKIIENRSNRGFCVANNQGIAASSGEYVLLVNTDVELADDFVATLVEELDRDTGLGWASGKLLRGPEPGDGSSRVIDSAGEVFFKTLRMVNRGEEEHDVGQLDQREEVFGVTAAAAIYRRSMLEDVRLGRSDYFDSDYFAYLEDSDLNWRAQLRGWRCLYQPGAVAEHSRQHATSRSVVIQRHAYANRYLGILKNASLWSLLLLAPHLLVYEAHRTLKTVLCRPGLLPAYFKVLRLASRALRKRRTIQKNRKASPRHLRSLMVPERYARELVEQLGVRSRARFRGSETRRDRAPA